MDIKVSVIVPVYNVEAYLPRCIDSLLEQTLSDIEIILVNDGSTDNCLEIIEQYMKIDERIRLVNKQNSGQSDARNVGLAQAKGEYIGFVDSDDWIETNMLELLYNAAKKQGCEVAVCNYSGVDINGTIGVPKLEMPLEDVLDLSEQRAHYLSNYITGKYVFNENAISHSICNKIFSRAFIEKHNLRFEASREVSEEDTFFMYYALLYIRRMAIVNQSLYYYCKRSGSTMNAYRINLEERWIEFIERIENRYREAEILEQVQPALNIKCFNILIEIINNEMYAKVSFRELYLKTRSLCNKTWFRSRIKGIQFASWKMQVLYYLFCFRLALVLCILLTIRQKYKN